MIQNVNSNIAACSTLHYVRMLRFSFAEFIRFYDKIRVKTLPPVHIKKDGCKLHLEIVSPHFFVIIFNF